MLGCLASLSRLAALRLVSPMRASDAGLAQLSCLRALQALTLNLDDEVSEGGLVAAVAGLPLRELNVQYKLLSDAGLSSFAQLSGLETLRLKGCRALEGRGFRDLTSLRSLDVVVCKGIIGDFFLPYVLRTYTRLEVRVGCQGRKHTALRRAYATSPCMPCQ